MAGYPHGKYRFRLEIDGLEAGGFSEVSGFDANIDVIEYREGDMVQTPLKLPGLKKYGNITFRQGLTDAVTLYEWVVTGVEGAVDRKTVTVTVLDEAGEPAASWQVINAWPMKYTAPDFNATSSEVAIEALELAHEGMTRVS
jgi:phage tail-like protein